MKYSKFLFAALTLCMFSFFTASAQDDREDVVYLKNGNIYRGVIVEQVPGQTLKVETLGGNVFTVQITDITKITKEKKVAIDNGPGQGPRVDGPPMHRPDDRRPDAGGWDRGHRGFNHNFHHYSFDSSRGNKSHEFHYRKKGYFFEAQLLGELRKGGVRIINGYKFGQFGYLGAGVGVDLLGFSPMGRLGGSTYPYGGTYLPLFLHYSGDILRKRITPYYTVDAGYAVRYSGNGRNNSPFTNFYNNQGGAMGGVGFGVKFITKHRVNFNLSANADFQTVKYVAGYNSFGNPDLTYKSGNKLSIFTPGLKFAIGF